MNRNRVRHNGVMMAMASFALVMLAACGGGEQAHEDVTRVPTMSDAAAQATREAASAPAATPGTEGGTPAAGATPVITGDETTTAATAIDVVSFDIYFEPSEITIPANTDVTVNLPNEGVTPHNFSIDALGIDVDIAPGATEQVVINAPAGEYEYYCNVPGHKQAGMVGTLIVSEDAAAAPAGAATPAEAPAEAPQATPAEQAAAATPAEPVAAASPAAVEAAAAQTVDIVAYDIYFEPKEVTIPANTDITFMIANDGVAPHNFSIDELGIDIDLPAGETQETVINAPAGEYEYYCNVPGHKEAGMVGKLIVSEDAATGATPAQAAVAPATPVAVGATPSAGGEEQAAGAEASEAVEVVSHDIFFEPDEVSIPAETDVTVQLPNEGVTLHNFSIDELGISVDIAPGASEETVINAPAGEYEFYCNVPGHKQAGMVGTLTVG
ncbi:MAG TPA: cupredoxin domain-containing protein [Thermomicrobiales bacterium]|nr:cupredoxin domain-containing protein [Thermomicrobiales bacterium]